MARTAIQLYTLREMDAPLPAVLERVAAAGFDGVEYAYRVPDADIEAVREALDATGLAVPGAHVRIEDLEDDQGATVEQYRELECERLVVPALDAEDFESVEATRAAGERLDTLADQLDAYDYPLAYHNHAFEFAGVDGRSAFEVLASATDSISFELDVGLAAYGGADPVELLETYGDRIELLHATDTDLDSNRPTHVSFGTGDIDYDAVFEAARTAGVEWHIYENGSHDDAAGELGHAVEMFV